MIGASSGSSPNCREWRRTMVSSGPTATSSAPIEATPVGPENSRQDAQRDDGFGP
jgi:hypothetical protein